MSLSLYGFLLGYRLPEYSSISLWDVRGGNPAETSTPVAQMPSWTYMWDDTPIQDIHLGFGYTSCLFFSFFRECIRFVLSWMRLSHDHGQVPGESVRQLIKQSNRGCMSETSTEGIHLGCQSLPRHRIHRRSTYRPQISRWMPT